MRQPSALSKKSPIIPHRFRIPIPFSPIILWILPPQLQPPCNPADPLCQLTLQSSMGTLYAQQHSFGPFVQSAVFDLSFDSYGTPLSSTWDFLTWGRGDSQTVQLVLSSVTRGA